MSPRRPRRFHSVAGLLLTLAALAIAACRPADGTPRVTAEWVGRPEARGESRVHLQVSDQASQPVEGARLQVQAFMSHPGMAPVTATVEELGGGRYQARVPFTMAGDWTLRVTGERRDGRRIDAALAVPGVAAPE